jgi:two-component system response regulator GlrR
MNKLIDWEERRDVKEVLTRKQGLRRILGSSKTVGELRQQLEHIAACDVNVLISGESGTGKELAARAIHYLSSRSHRPIVPVNCGAIPENLFENELFGHRKGAFTDASSHQGGLVTEADGGTLFLDEIGVITPYIQVKLLRLLQEKEYKTLGDSKTRKANVRIIAATNQDLPRMVKSGDFREDLYFRLNIVSLTIPPLRERKEDIPELVAHFIDKYSHEYGKVIKRVSEKAMVALLSYAWPGNIRELENKIQHAIVMTGNNRISAHDLDLSPVATQTGKNIALEELKEAKQRIITDFEKNYLLLVLASCGGDISCAAQQAGKSRTAFWNLLAKHHLHPKQLFYEK